MQTKILFFCENVVFVYDDEYLKSLSDFLVKKLTGLYK